MIPMGFILALEAAQGITLSWQSVITAGAVVAALTAIITLLVKLVRWVDRQKQQDTDLKNLRARHDKDNSAIQEELTLLTYGILACLKGLHEQGINGPVSEAIGRFEKYINKKAHECKEES